MKRINWKVRFKNKTWLMTLFATVVAFIYQLFGIFGFASPIAQDTIIQLIGLALTVLAGVGVIQDPTTAGVGDSSRALDYDKPSAEEATES